jgi:hypothetical protein
MACWQPHIIDFRGFVGSLAVVRSRICTATALNYDLFFAAMHLASLGCSDWTERVLARQRAGPGLPACAGH